MQFLSFFRISHFGGERRLLFILCKSFNLKEISLNSASLLYFTCLWTHCHISYLFFILFKCSVTVCFHCNFTFCLLPLNIHVKLEPVEQSLGHASHRHSQISVAEGNFSASHHKPFSPSWNIECSSVQQWREFRKKMVLRLYILLGWERTIGIH